ncbi:hypothetical protein KCU61_g444, partial [Aureobasidium melanogenum]
MPSSSSDSEGQHISRGSKEYVSGVCRIGKATDVSANALWAALLRWWVGSSDVLGQPLIRLIESGDAMRASCRPRVWMMWSMSAGGGLYTIPHMVGSA